MTEIRVVNAPLSGKDEIKRLSRQTFEAHRERQPFAFSLNLFDILLGSEIERAFQDPHGKPLASSERIFVAVQGDTFCGYIMISEENASYGGRRPSISVKDICVLEPFRRQGIGRALVDHVRALSEAHDWDNLEATVWHGNQSSASLFRAAGFQPQSETLRYGPIRQARDYPIPSPASKAARKPQGWGILIVLAVFLVLKVLQII